MSKLVSICQHFHHDVNIISTLILIQSIALIEWVRLGTVVVDHMWFWHSMQRVDEWCSGWFHNILWTLSKFDEILIRSPLKWVCICVTVGWVSEWVSEWVMKWWRFWCLSTTESVTACSSSSHPLQWAMGRWSYRYNQWAESSDMQSEWVSEWVTIENKIDLIIIWSQNYFKMIFRLAGFVVIFDY